VQISSASLEALLWTFPLLDIPVLWSYGRPGEPDMRILSICYCNGKLVCARSATLREMRWLRTVCLGNVLASELPDLCSLIAPRDRYNAALFSVAYVKVMKARRCGPCRAVFPHLSKIAKTYTDKGLVVVGISIEADSPQLDAFVARQQMDYTVAVSEQCAQGPRAHVRCSMAPKSCFRKDVLTQCLGYPLLKVGLS